MMRMLAWIDLRQTNGYVNKPLSLLHLVSQPVNWLGGLGVTVVFGLVYGYIPYLILVLYAGLDRIDQALIEAGRDLGLGRVRTFVRVTLPLSRQPILSGMLITVMPMLGDYFTNQLLSGTTGTTMFGNVVDDRQRRSRAERARHDHAGHVVRHRDRRLPRLPLPDPRRTGQRDRRPHHDRRRRLTLPAGFSHFYPERARRVPHHGLTTPPRETPSSRTCRSPPPPCPPSAWRRRASRGTRCATTSRSRTTRS